MEGKFEEIATALTQKNYTKKKVPTLNQIKRFLKKEKSVSKVNIDSITAENVLEKWGLFAS